MYEETIKCISCGKCTQNCIFLKKYGLNFSNEEELKKLSYHCMLCGTCTRVCPINLDGRARMLHMRTEIVCENSGKLQGYWALRLEKNNYKFKNYRKGKKKSVLFPGCNYPSLFPKTLEKLMGLMQQHEVGVVFDCCGKPIAELGLQKEENAIIEALTRRLQENEIEEMIVLCPNCYYYLAEKISIPVVSIYEKLPEFGIKYPPAAIKKDFHLFLPCPDRKSKQLLSSIQPFLPGQIHEIQEIQCCGLGGAAPAKESQYTAVLTERLRVYKQTKQCENIYVYCASCAGSFKRKKIEGVHHVLSDILQTNEQADSTHSLYNRVKCVWK